jgi:hypothetical protein
MLKFGFKKEEGGSGKASKNVFPFPYLYVGPKPTEFKKTTRFQMSDSVRDLLKFGIKDNKLSWIYDETDDKFFKLINISSMEAAPTIDVTLDLQFSNKKFYEKLIKILKLDETKEHYFELINVEPIATLPTVKLVKVDVDTLTSPMTEEARATRSELDIVNEESKFNDII